MDWIRLALDRVHLWGLCESGNEHLGSMKAEKFLDRRNDCDLFSKQSVRRDVVLPFLHKSCHHSCARRVIVGVKYFVCEERTWCLRFQGKIRCDRVLLVNARELATARCCDSERDK